MKETIVKCQCDNCSELMSESEYDQAVSVTIKVDVPGRRGDAGVCNGIVLRLCDKCAKSLEISPSQIYGGPSSYSNNILAAVKWSKSSLLKLMSKWRSSR